MFFPSSECVGSSSFFVIFRCSWFGGLRWFYLSGGFCLFGWGLNGLNIVCLGSLFWHLWCLFRVDFSLRWLFWNAQKQLSLIVQIDAHTLRSSYRHLLLASRRPRHQPCWIRSEWLLQRRRRSTTQQSVRPRRLLLVRPLRPRFRSHRKRQRLECPRLLRQPFRWLYQRRREFLCKQENFRVSMKSWITLGRAVIDGLPGELFFSSLWEF